MKTSKGFTLIEMLIASSCALIIIAAASFCLISFMKQLSPIMEQTRIHQVERFVAAKITRDYVQSSGINSSSTSSKLATDGFSYETVNGKVKHSTDKSSDYLTNIGEVNLSFSYSNQKLIRVDIGRSYSFYVFARN
jgi:prepilin-type N-terminal cleavage/methylation domain-containing protein